MKAIVCLQFYHGKHYFHETFIGIDGECSKGPDAKQNWMIAKGKPEAVNGRRTDTTMPKGKKTKGQTINYKTLHEI